MKREILNADLLIAGGGAPGVNALNAYITEDYVAFVRRDAEGIIRDDLVLSMAERFNEAAADLERMGLVILKDGNGKYAVRGEWNIKINGENIKPFLAAELRRYSNITVLNHVNVTDYLFLDGRVCGAAGFLRRWRVEIPGRGAVVITTDNRSCPISLAKTVPSHPQR